MEALKNAAKAVVAAVVSFGAILLAQWFNFEIPIDMQGWIVNLAMSAVTAALVYLVPNKKV